MNFTAIDFEIARYKRNSICQVGLVQVEGGKIVDEKSIFVQPPENIYRKDFTENVHGIGPKDTADAPFFNEVWEQIKPYIEGQNVVAHNGFSFDFDVLKKTLAHYELEEPDYQKICTLKIYGKNLADLCREHSIDLNHHEALSDARACAELFLMHLNTEKNSEGVMP